MWVQGEETMSERPTLTVAVACPTCGGTTDARFSEKGRAYSREHGTNDCPKCPDGTIQRAVGCQSCRWASPITDDEIECALLLMKNSPDWGCLSWQAKA